MLESPLIKKITCSSSKRIFLCGLLAMLVNNLWKLCFFHRIKRDTNCNSLYLTILNLFLTIANLYFILQTFLLRIEIQTQLKKVMKKVRWKTAAITLIILFYFMANTNKIVRCKLGILRKMNKHAICISRKLRKRISHWENCPVSLRNT